MKSLKKNVFLEYIHNVLTSMLKSEHAYIWELSMLMSMLNKMWNIIKIVFFCEHIHNVLTSMLKSVLKWACLDLGIEYALEHAQ